MVVYIYYSIQILCNDLTRVPEHEACQSPNKVCH